MAEKKIDPKDDDIHPLSRHFLFLGEKKTKENFIWLPILGMVITVMCGLIPKFKFDPHHMAPWDFFASWAVIGFIAYSFVVFSADPLFRLLSRDENYYGEGDDDD